MFIISKNINQEEVVHYLSLLLKSLSALAEEERGEVKNEFPKKTNL